MAIPINRPVTMAGVSPNCQTYGIKGNLAVAAGAARFYFNRAVTVTDVRASVGTAPTTQSVIVDVNKNGTTIFTTQGNRPTIAAGANTDASSTPDVTAFAAGDYMTVDVDQIGTGTVGADLTVQVWYEG
jgi:hypothetical protein